MTQTILKTIDIDATLDRLTDAVEKNGRTKGYHPLDIVDDVIGMMMGRIARNRCHTADYERACVCLLGIDKSFADDLQAISENFYEWERKHGAADDEY